MTPMTPADMLLNQILGTLLLAFVLVTVIFVSAKIWQRGAKRDRLTESRAKDKALNRPASHSHG
jgi:uncharacterized membrane protein